ncbi:hypothetical protein B0H19DRAFT_218262 [Mycena capillaripes]|nr:hypothetical protein B0H19DRAFT_218262 [Mycena capillaripes]
MIDIYSHSIWRERGRTWSTMSWRVLSCVGRGRQSTIGIQLQFSAEQRKGKRAESQSQMRISIPIPLVVAWHSRTRSWRIPLPIKIGRRARIGIREDDAKCQSRIALQDKKSHGSQSQSRLSHIAVSQCESHSATDTLESGIEIREEDANTHSRTPPFANPNLNRNTYRNANVREARIEEDALGSGIWRTRIGFFFEIGQGRVGSWM